MKRISLIKVVFFIAKNEDDENKKELDVVDEDADDKSPEEGKINAVSFVQAFGVFVIFCL